MFRSIFGFFVGILQEVISFAIPFLPKVPLARVDRAGGFYLPETPSREDFIYTKTWATVDKPRAILIAVHGLGEHINRYNHVFDEFAKNGIQTVGLDLHGHGRSTGRRGAPPRFKRIFDTIDQVRNLGKKDGVKTFLFGHSMGGLIVLSYVAERPGNFDGVIASAPALGVAYKVSPALEFTAKSLSTIPVLNQITIANGLPLSGLSRDPKVLEDYKQDPLVHDKISVQLGGGAILQGEKMRSQGLGSRINIPVLIAHGDKDSLTSFSASQAFIQTVASQDATFLPYEGFYHELHNEPERELVIKNYINWIVNHL